MASEKIISWDHATLVSLATMDYAISHVMSEYTNDTKIRKGFMHSSILSILIAALYDILPNVEIRKNDEPGKIYL